VVGCAERDTELLFGCSKIVKAEDSKEKEKGKGG
jgi:hypothetical protein